MNLNQLLPANDTEEGVLIDAIIALSSFFVSPNHFLHSYTNTEVNYGILLADF
ncbi:MAG: hypothetical protein LBI20_02955 [Holosporales bacterium]|jgi:hypothetical protein|nr:hypothetical protein [Holosporales bacterium]